MLTYLRPRLLILGAMVAVASITWTAIAWAGGTHVTPVRAILGGSLHAGVLGDPMPIEPGVHIIPPARGHWAGFPPTSGEHYSIPGVAPAPWGFTGSRMPPEVWVHNLEHGGVVILFSCTSECAQYSHDIQALIAAAPSDPHFHEVKLLDAPLDMPGHPFAVVAWGWRMWLDHWDPGPVLDFYAQHVDQGPEWLP